MNCVGFNWNFGSSGAKNTYGRTGNTETGNAFIAENTHTIDSNGMNDIWKNEKIIEKFEFFMKKKLSSKNTSQNENLFEWLPSNGD